MADLNKWVDGQLMRLMGCYTPLVSRHVIRLAKEASSLPDLTAKLLDNGGLLLSEDLRTFASALYQKVSHVRSGLTAYQIREREAAELVRKQGTYKRFGKNDIVDVRKRSRHAYLERRREKKLSEVEAEIRYEEDIFGGLKLTQKEKWDLWYKKKLCELGKKRSDEDSTDQYRMPDVYDIDGSINQKNRFSVAKLQYRDPVEKKMPFTEKAWVQIQLEKAILKFGSKDGKRNDDYDYVFEEQKDFVEVSDSGQKPNEEGKANFKRLQED